MFRSVTVALAILMILTIDLVIAVLVLLIALICVARHLWLHASGYRISR